jgi:hypothetical protein
MGVIFKKNGRPTKAEKGTLKNINNFLSSLGEDEKSSYSFSNEKVTSGERLNDIWESIISPKEEKPTQAEVLRDKLHEMNSRQQTEHGEVDTQTGEIFEETEKVEQEETNFVNNKEEMEEHEAELLEEANAADLNEEIDETPSSFNPLSQPVKRRSYQKKGTVDVGEIDEPDFGNKQSAEERLDEINHDQEVAAEESAYAEMESAAEEEEAAAEPSEWDNLRNEGMEELDKKDAQLASKQLVETVLDGYEMLHDLGKKFVKYPEEKLQEKAISGEIDPTMEIPIDEHGNTTNPIEFFQQFNEQAEEAISYDPEFGEKVRPAMERVFAKKGWGMTDEQFLLVAFGKDIAWKGVQIMTLKKTANGIMSTFERLQKEKIAEMRKQRRHEAAQAAPLEADSIVTPPKQEQQTYQAENNAHGSTEHRGYYTEEGVQGENINEEVHEENTSTEIVPLNG